MIVWRKGSDDGQLECSEDGGRIVLMLRKMNEHYSTTLNAALPCSDAEGLARFILTEIERLKGGAS